MRKLLLIGFLIVCLNSFGQNLPPAKIDPAVWDSIARSVLKEFDHTGKYEISDQLIQSLYLPPPNEFPYKEYNKLLSDIQVEYMQVLSDLKSNDCNKDLLCELSLLNSYIDHFNKFYAPYLKNKSFYGFAKYKLKLVTE